MHWPYVPSSEGMIELRKGTDPANFHQQLVPPCADSGKTCNRLNRRLIPFKQLCWHGVPIATGCFDVYFFLSTPFNPPLDRACHRRKGTSSLPHKHCPHAAKVQTLMLENPNLKTRTPLASHRMIPLPPGRMDHPKQCTVLQATGRMSGQVTKASSSGRSSSQESRLTALQRCKITRKLRGRLPAQDLVHKEERDFLFESATEKGCIVTVEVRASKGSTCLQAKGRLGRSLDKTKIKELGWRSRESTCGRA